MVSVGAGNPASGHGVGETPKRMLEIFENYQSACEYVDRSLKAYVDSKYQGLKVETQMNIFDFLEWLNDQGTKTAKPLFVFLREMGILSRSNPLDDVAKYCIIAK